MKMDKGTQCIMCDKTFNVRDLANHLASHAAIAMDKNGEIQKMKTTKMQVMMENMKLPLEQTKRKREGSGEVDTKRIKIQDGSQEISVNCLVDRPSCKICKPQRQFKDSQAYRYHMVMTHSEGTNSSGGSSQLQGSFSFQECLSPSKSRIRVKSHPGSVEMVDMTQDSPVKSTAEIIMNKLKFLQRSTGSLNETKGTTRLKGVDKISSKSVNIRFNDFIAPESESDFELTDKDVPLKCINSKSSEASGDVVSKVTTAATSVLIQQNTQSGEEPKLCKSQTSKSSTSEIVSSQPLPEDLKDDSQFDNPKVNGSFSDKSPRSKSGRPLIKSKRLISSDSTEIDAPLRVNGVCVDKANEKKSPKIVDNKKDQISKPKTQSESDSYVPNVPSSDSGTTFSDVDFVRPLRKSCRVKGPKPPQIRDPIPDPPKRRHSERKFEGAKPYKCNHCPLSYSNIESKRVHEQTHQEEKPIHCVYCDMRFALEISLKKHSRIHNMKLN